MSGAEVFFDTNVALYLASADAAKAARAEVLIGQGGVISVQVLDEFASVMSRKYEAPWPVIRDLLAGLRRNVAVEQATIETHELGLRIAERYRYAVYDSMLLAAALLAGCTTFYSEDLHDGQVIENTLTIRNPFLPT